MELFEALDAGHTLLHSTIVDALPSGWTNASPCEGWTVRDVAHHVVGGAVRYRLLLEGFGEEALVPTRTDDQLGDDPAASDAEKSAALMAVARTADLSASVQHPTGPRTGTQLLNLRVLECVAHSWDMRVGAGLDPGIDPDLCAFALARMDDMGNLGGFFEAPATAKSTDPQAVLLARCGREPT
ncbi:MAG TPA: maleylpyruvate isomerase family mycothiol-dependent enzyme [Mycobacteriales bacterium]|nr:maleylpyruvate isomerase family mycothiol-dependent enzyme [Mycobacteriales bacterium]